MTAVPETTWPPCDLCGAEESIASVMILATYQTTRIGGACLPDYFRAIADQVAGVPAAEMPAGGADSHQDAPAAPAAPETEQCPMCGAMVSLDAIPAHVEGHMAENPELAEAPEQGSARDHWASTTNVRRSTHGHRKPRGQAATADDGVPS